MPPMTCVLVGEKSELVELDTKMKSIEKSVGGLRLFQANAAVEAVSTLAVGCTVLACRAGVGSVKTLFFVCPASGSKVASVLLSHPTFHNLSTESHWHTWSHPCSFPKSQVYGKGQGGVQ